MQVYLIEQLTRRGKRYKWRRFVSPSRGWTYANAYVDQERAERMRASLSGAGSKHRYAVVTFEEKAT